MTLRSFINFGDSLHVVAGVNIHFRESSVVDISYCILKQEKDVVRLVKVAENISSIIRLKENLYENLPEGARVHINIDGFGILSKTIEKNEGLTDQDTQIKKIFPMIREEEFITQIYDGSKSYFFSIVRNDVFSELEWMQEKYGIVSISLGLLISDRLIPFIKGQSVLLEGTTIEFENERISEIKRSQGNEPATPFMIGDDVIAQRSLLACASSWNILFPSPDMNAAAPSWVESSADRNNFQRHFFKAARFLLITVLGALLLNTGIYFLLNTNVEELEARNNLFSGQHEKNNRLQNRISEITSLYENIGWESNVMPVYYADQLAQKVTSEIKLTSLEIGVLDNEILKKEKRYEYAPGIIKIKGIAENPVMLQHWTNELQKLVWVKDLANQKYQYDGKLRKGIFEFYIYLK